MHIIRGRTRISRFLNSFQARSLGEAPPPHATAKRRCRVQRMLKRAFPPPSLPLARRKEKFCSSQRPTYRVVFCRPRPHGCSSPVVYGEGPLIERVIIIEHHCISYPLEFFLGRSISTPPLSSPPPRK